MRHISRVPLSLTAKERKALATLLTLVLLGLLGIVVLGERPPTAPEPAVTGFARPGSTPFPTSRA